MTAIVLVVIGFVLKALGSFEQPLSTAVNQLHQGVLGALGTALYRGFGPAPAIIGTLVITIVILVARRDLRVASTFAFTVAGTWLSVAVVKLLVDRHRPDATVMSFPYTPVQHDASFPSGHGTFIVILVIALVALVPRHLRPAATVLGAIIVAFAGFLLVVDGVHFTTDVLASVLWCLGVGPFVRAVWVRLVLPRAQFLTPKRIRQQDAERSGDRSIKPLHR
ncbi:MAG: phosphatase PAP2 family protein [Acidobacteria bacterium]|nr:phosphatase PAP2 family protein [Acidobacteriota bacterium]